MRIAIVTVIVFGVSFLAAMLARARLPAPRDAQVPVRATPPPPEAVLVREVAALESEVAALRKAPPQPAAVSDADRILARLDVADEAEREARAALLMLELGGSAEKRAALVAAWEAESDLARLARIEELLDDLAFRLDPAVQAALARLLLAGQKGARALFALRHVDLGQPPDAKLLEAIRSYGEDPDPAVRRLAVKALADVREDDVAEWKSRMARGDADPSVRAAAVRGLDFDDERKACLDLAAHVVQHETDVRVRQVAVNKLCQDLAMTVTGIGAALAPEEQSRLWKVFCHAAERDTDPEVRSNAVGMIAFLWRAKALPALEARLPHETDAGVKENIEALIAILKEGRTGLMEFAGEAQKRIRHFTKPSRPFEDEE